MEIHREIKVIHIVIHKVIHIFSKIIGFASKDFAARAARQLAQLGSSRSSAARAAPQLCIIDRASSCFLAGPGATQIQLESSFRGSGIDFRNELAFSRQFHDFSKIDSRASKYALELDLSRSRSR